jgi:lipid II:glycine glycyltransferase (peptidoglycan interpeptide bridge formation enzyme)
MLVSLLKNDNVASGVFLQSRFWADFKALAGWTFSRYEVNAADDTFQPFALSVLERRLGSGLRFAYIPHGPDSTVPASMRGDLLLAIAGQLKDLVSRACVFVRFDPAWYESEARISVLSDYPDLAESAASAESAGISEEPARPRFALPLIRGSDVQPPDSVVLAIDKSDEELLAGMKSKWRYNVRLAEKKGVQVAVESMQGLEEFYSLYQSTAIRDRIAIHPRTYYERLFALPPSNPAEPKPDIRLWIARYEGKALAAIITVFYSKEATYLYGASSDEHRNLMPAYALQWAAIRAARDTGCVSYDFYGIPPVEDPEHAMSGLYRFKTGFGGEIRHYAGSWDYVLKPVVYAAFRAAERLRLFWHKNVRKRLGH